MRLAPPRASKHRFAKLALTWFGCVTVLCEGQVLCACACACVCADVVWLRDSFAYVCARACARVLTWSGWITVDVNVLGLRDGYG